MGDPLKTLACRTWLVSIKPRASKVYFCLLIFSDISFPCSACDVLWCWICSVSGLRGTDDGIRESNFQKRQEIAKSYQCLRRAMCHDDFNVLLKSPNVDAANIER